MVLVTDEKNIVMEDSCEEEFVCGDRKGRIRVGDEYQAEIPPLMSESERAAYLGNPLESNSSGSFVVGRPVEVMWIDDNVDMNDTLKSFKTKRNRRGGNAGNSGSKQRMNLEPVPGLSSSWDDLEVDGLVLGLYTFGKNFTQVKKLMDSKAKGEVISFFYGKFYKSAKHKIWSNSLKKRSRRIIHGKKLYSDWRLQVLLSRLIPNIQDELQTQKLVDVSKLFAEGKKSLEEYISAVKELVGLQSLVEAVAIGKDKEDLTALTTEPVKTKQWFTVSSGIPSGLGRYGRISVKEILSRLTGSPRLSKTRCNELFYDAVWPRLLDNGWDSEQTQDRGYTKSKEHIVYLVPGVKKFSRRKHIRKNHYYDSISDILNLVVSKPDLLVLEDEKDGKAPNGVIKENTCEQSNKKKHRYLMSPGSSSSTQVKFTVVDTTRLASGGKLCEVRELSIPEPESVASQSKTCQGDNNSAVERPQMMPSDALRRAKIADEERRWERRRTMKVVDEPMSFMIVDTSVDQVRHSSGIRRRRDLPDDTGFGDSSQNKSGNSAGGKCEYPTGTDSAVKAAVKEGTDSAVKEGTDSAVKEGTDSAVKEETLENVQQGLSKKSKPRSVRKSEANNHLSVSSFPVPKRRRLSACVRKDIKRSGESSVLKPPASDEKTNGYPKLSVNSVNIKTEPLDETEDDVSLHAEVIQEKQKTEPKGLFPISKTVHERSSAMKQEPIECDSISVVLDSHCFANEQGAPHELSSSKQQQQGEPNRLCSDGKRSSKYLETAQQQEQLVQLSPKSASEKNSPSSDHGTAQEPGPIKQEEEEQNQQTNTEVSRRQSTRKRPLTLRALEAIESGQFPTKCFKTTSTPRKRERSTKSKPSAKTRNRTQGEANNAVLVKEAATSKPLDRVEDSEQSFLVNKATTESKPVDQMEDSKKVTTEFPKLPPIVFKVPNKRG